MSTKNQSQSQDQDKKTPVVPKSGRLVSLDALRGFDMLWIMGGERIIVALADLTGAAGLAWAATQMDHVEWNGFHFYDLIFPLFLFIAGVSMPFSMDKRLAAGESKVKIYRHIFVRMLILVIFGIIYNGFLEFDRGNIRYASVLGRIGLGWFFAALIVLNSKPKWWYAWFGGILLFYWAILKLIPVPGYGAGDLSMEGSIVGYVDRLLLPGRLYLEVHDPEGILSTIPAVSTALLGAITGNFLRIPFQQISGLKKALWMGLSGILLLGAGWLWGLVFPINKNLWTSSFVLYAGGWSLILLAIFYLIIDVWGWKKWAFFFIVIGLNSITIYMFQAGIINFRSSTEFFFGGIIKSFAENWQPLIGAIGYTTVCWVFLYVLYKYRIFLKV
jgi:predicted acyltransferase